jgi:hypothetical protein
LQVYVSNLRTACGRERIARRGPGYVLAAEPDEIDLRVFERLASDGRARLGGRAGADGRGRMSLAVEMNPRARA